MNNDRLLWLIVAGLLIAGTGTGMYIMARGIRNNNPGNIRHSPSEWQGMSATQTDKEYIQFDNPVYGIRAIAKLLKNYERRYGINTIRGFISRWAPPTENITSSYVDHVARVASVGPDSPIRINDYLIPVVTTIIDHENGMQPYTDEQISEGIRLAG